MEKQDQIIQPWQCPRCGGLVEQVDGWIEYGDQLVEIFVLGCFKCGWRDEDSELDQLDEWDLT